MKLVAVPAIVLATALGHAGTLDLPALCERAAEKYGVPASLVRAVVAIESGGNPFAISPKGAKGLMQLMPATAARFAVADPFDPVQSLEGGCAYLRWLLDHFDGQVPLALAGYNAGEGVVDAHGGIPPYQETLEYVRKVLEELGKAMAPPGRPRVEAASYPVRVEGTPRVRGAVGLAAGPPSGGMVFVNRSAR